MFGGVYSDCWSCTNAVEIIHPLIVAWMLQCCLDAHCFVILLIDSLVIVLTEHEHASYTRGTIWYWLCKRLLEDVLFWTSSPVCDVCSCVYYLLPYGFMRSHCCRGMPIDFVNGGPTEGLRYCTLIIMLIMILCVFFHVLLYIRMRSKAWFGARMPLRLQ